MLNTKIIEKMSYTDFIALIKETNRCPGGKDSVRTIIQNTLINEGSRVLEIGSNTGFTSLEIAHTIRCKIRGIDVSRNCVQESKNRLELDIPEIKKLVKFKVGSAYNIPYKSNSFDLVITGGATSFMDNKQKAINEYIRVTKPWRYISATQLFYVKKPPQKIVDDVSEAIGSKINVWGESDWLNVFRKNPELELYFYKTHKLFDQPKGRIDRYIQYFLNKPHMKPLESDVKKSIENKWRRYINIFNENHKYLGYFIAIFRKNVYEEEPELFIQR